MTCLTNSVFYCIKSWIHFIYGKRSSNQNILYTTKEINREHPNAYLPLILHQHYNLIRGMLKSDPKTGLQPDLFHLSVEIQNEKNDNKGMKSTIKGKGSDLGAPLRSDTLEEEVEDEEQKTVKLKSLLWDVDLPQGLRVTSKLILI